MHLSTTLSKRERREIVDIAMGLIRIPSITGNRAAIEEAMTYVKTWLGRHKIEATLRSYRGRLVLTAEVGPVTGPILVWHGHLDVVPPAAESEPEPRPSAFEPWVEAGRLYGRGASDMKAPIACMMIALRRLAAQKKSRVRLVLVADEEDSGAVHSIADFMRVYPADFLITGEPTDFSIGVEALGALFPEIVVEGRSGHAAYPERAENPILAAGRLIEAVVRLPFTQQTTRWFPRGPVVVPTEIHAGTAPNVIPPTIRLIWSIRFLSGQDPDRILEEIRGLSGVDGLPRFTVAAPPPIPAASVPEDDPCVRSLADLVPRRFRKGDVLVAQRGASDLAFTSVPGVEFGPVGYGHHGARECVETGLLAPYAEILIEFALRFPGAWWSTRRLDESLI